MYGMYRKYGGSKKVALKIYQYGAPALIISQGSGDTGLLQSNMRSCLDWFVRLADDLVEYEAQPEYAQQQSLGSGVADQTKKQRRQALKKSKHDLRRGKQLAFQRDEKWVSFEEMNSADQALLHDLETGKVEKTIEANKVRRPKPFRATSSQK